MLARGSLTKEGGVRMLLAIDLTGDHETPAIKMQMDCGPSLQSFVYARR